MRERESKRACGGKEVGTEKSTQGPARLSAAEEREREGEEEEGQKGQRAGARSRVHAHGGRESSASKKASERQ